MAENSDGSVTFHTFVEYDAWCRAQGWDGAPEGLWTDLIRGGIALKVKPTAVPILKEMTQQHSTSTPHEGRPDTRSQQPSPTAHSAPTKATGKDPDQFPLAKRVNLAVDKDCDRARGRLREWFGSYYNDPDRADRVSVWGSADQVVEGLQEVVSAGARLVILSPVFDGMEQMELLASEVVPHLNQ